MPDGLDETSQPQTARQLRVVIVTGLSGSGKSTAIRALEDMGYFCIDNLPVPLLPKVLELAGTGSPGNDWRRLAFVIDTRDHFHLDQAVSTIEELREEGASVSVKQAMIAKTSGSTDSLR